MAPQVLRTLMVLYDTDLKVDGHKIMIFDIRFNTKRFKHHSWDREKEKNIVVRSICVV